MTQNMTLAYKNNTIQTASPAELTLMLYDGAIKFCNIALGALENNDPAKANTNIIKAENIIVEFRSTLDFKYPVAQDFDRVYDWIYRRLVEANIKKDTEILEDALKLIREMRDTWKEVMRLNRVKTDKPQIQYISAAQKQAALG
ncbi:MAG: flagellar export chaperone FliS [Lachnospiraceae bacterium]|nr:flagellar export chaperone FliS [Lachnospiraceae bacterium]